MSFRNVIQIGTMRITLFGAFLLVIYLFIQATTASVQSKSLPEADPGDIYLPVITTSIGKSYYYISPSGNDNNGGTSPAAPWATFDRAWKDLHPGDTLILMDGVYHESLIPDVRNGQPDNPITIRAYNDGQAIIDGDGVRSPVVRLGDTFGGEPGENPVGNYFVIEGIVARDAGPDSTGNVIHIHRGNNNILRRVSAYNAHPDTNSGVIKVTGDHNLIEDCVAAGTGRKMIYITGGEHNVIRRCLADWRGWDGRLWHDCWPWGDGIEIYNASNNIIENSIAYSRNPTYAVNVQAQGNGRSTNNKILGTMAVLAGMKEDGVTPMVWEGPRPQPSKYTCVRDFDWPVQMSGFRVYEGGAQVSGTLFQDILAWGNAGLGLGWTTAGGGDPATGNNHINRATLFHNGLNNSDARANGGDYIDTRQEDLDGYDSVTNSSIERIYVEWPGHPNPASRILTSMSGEGARLTHRYVNGVLTNQPLWPWPMEGRIKAELGYSITPIMQGIINSAP